MKKNSVSVSDIFVNKINEKGQKLFTKKEILTLWSRSGGSQSRSAYALSLLVRQGMIVRVAKDVYLRSPASFDQSYWKIISALVDIYAPSGAILGGEKGLEVHLLNYSIPQTLILYTRSTRARVSLIDGRVVHFRTLVSGTKTHSKNLFPRISQLSHIQPFSPKIYIPCPEIALLEALSVREHDMGISESTVLRYLERYHTELREDIFLEIIRYRYIRAINRLREMARDQGYEKLYQSTLLAIHREGGGCFITSSH